MAYHFSANQFDSAYKPKGLNNWELPKWYPPRPRQRKGSTKVIANDRGHLLEKNSLKVNKNPWGNFRNTYQLPDKINRNFVQDYNKCLVNKEKWSGFPPETNICNNINSEHLHIANKEALLPCATINKEFSKCAPNQNRRLDFDKKKDSIDLEYIPGDLTTFEKQHPTRDFLLEDKYKRDHNIKEDLTLNKNYLGDHECKLGECDQPPINLLPLLPQTSPLVTSNLSPKIRELDTPNEYNINGNTNNLENQNITKMFSGHSITEKPNERCPSPVIPAYANFELAKRMHSNNLDHQPLPDCVADLAFRKLQITGGNPGLALDIEPIATGVGIKTHNAGPTHCTKMRVYRPKTSGVVPKVYEATTITRSFSATPADKKMGAMDLAICWDYKPPYDPPRPSHIDGSNDSAGPAVFTYVKTPRDDDVINTGCSTGVFTNTLGETNFFDKDILRRKTDFSGRKISADDFPTCIDTRPTFPRARSVSRENSACHKLPETRFHKQYKSTPDMFADQEYKALREKYLGADCEFRSTPVETGCKRSSFLKKARSRLCHKIAPETNCCATICPPKRMACKTAFRAGVPRYNAAGNFISSDSGCSMDGPNSQRVLVIPRPRNPYTKRNYDIDTLVPPFRSYAGGAGEGGYPEHWRLASVYQHAYKPLENRRKPLLQTVYK